MRKSLVGGLSCSLLALGLLAGCGMTGDHMMGEKPMAASEASLYDRLGGMPAIHASVDSFLANVAADNRINGRFAEADLGRLNGLLVDQICQATGGPCTYKGLPMREAHAGMNITEGEFNALAEDLIAALDSLGVPEKEKNELVGAIAGMKGDVVGL